MNSAFVVGGPYSGKIVRLPHECRVWSMPKWPSPERVMRLDPMTFGRDPLEIINYRWHQAITAVPYGELRCACLVHESMSDEDAERAVVVGFMASMMMDAAQFWKGKKPKDLLEWNP